jgi:hypothetical protein
MFAAITCFPPPQALSQAQPYSTSAAPKQVLGIGNSASVSTSAETPSAMLVRPQTSLARMPESHVVNKKFLAAHAVLWGGFAYDALLTQYGVDAHRCVEGTWISSGSTWFHGTYYPNGHHHFVPGREYGTLVPIYAAATVADWMMRRKHVRLVPYVIPVALGVPHWVGGSEWLTQHCF